MRFLLGVALALSIVGCAPTTPAATPAATAAPVVPPTLTEAPRPSSTPAPLVLHLWVAAAFAPDPATEAGARMQARLTQFESDHPGVQVEVRLKDEAGPAGLFATLQTAARVAPAALPDLVTLDSSDLVEAAAGGVLAPLAPFPEGADTGTFAFARQAAQVGEIRYGAPFAARVDVLVFRTDSFFRAPGTWSDLLSSTPPFLFPAGDPDSQVTLAQYLALGAAPADETGKPRLDPLALEEVLAFYGSAHTAGLLPLTVRQYETSLETWEVFHEGRATSAVAPLQTYLSERRSTELAGPLPTRDGEGVSLASVWSWALVTPNPQRQPLALELIDLLSEPGFLAGWTQALGLLPADRASLDGWHEGDDKNLAVLLAAVARPLPAPEVRAGLGAPIRAAVDSVLSGQLTPNAAAMAAAQAVTPP
jgi:ABC-type glycerol-3-phosphate transport system substrate-binding protein